MCFDFLYKFCLKYFSILRRTERDMIKNVLSDFNETRIFMDRLSKKILKYEI